MSEGSYISALPCAFVVFAMTTYTLYSLRKHAAVLKQRDDCIFFRNRNVLLIGSDRIMPG